jgi:uncharacterized protein YecE (DUF72 family)
MLSRFEIPDVLADRLRIGTCSWKYDSWRGLVYDPGREYGPYDYLADYARYFNSVEIDQWFWSLYAGGVRLPDTAAAKRYAESVPENFRFTVKVANSITLTHYYARQSKGADPTIDVANPRFLQAGLLSRFIEAIEPLHPKLGPLMFQFEYLNKTKMPSLRAFCDQLHEFFEKAPKGFMYGVETRNPNYLSEEFFSFLRSHGLGAVLLDGYYMPPLSRVAARPDVHTAGFMVIRLHGPSRAAMEEETESVWDQIVAPHDQGLATAAGLIQANARAGVETYVDVNNHYEGSAPLTIQRLMDLLAGAQHAGSGKGSMG